MASPGYYAFKLAFQISPILLTRGIAASVPGGILPIVAITEGANFITGLLTGGPDIDLDKFFANFQVAPGGTLLNQSVGTYPYANQAVAANATIQQPNIVSMIMTCPARGDAGYVIKLATMQALQRTLSQHNSLGGTYTVCTPGFIYFDMIMNGPFRDISGGQSAQVQTQWQIDFIQPLVALADARSALNTMMQKIQSGLPLSTSSSPAAGLPFGSGITTPGINVPLGSSLTQILPQ